MLFWKRLLRFSWEFVYRGFSISRIRWKEGVIFFVFFGPRNWLKQVPFKLDQTWASYGSNRSKKVQKRCLNTTGMWPITSYENHPDISIDVSPIWIGSKLSELRVKAEKFVGQNWESCGQTLREFWAEKGQNRRATLTDITEMRKKWFEMFFSG